MGSKLCYVFSVSSLAKDHDCILLWKKEGVGIVIIIGGN